MRLSAELSLASPGKQRNGTVQVLCQHQIAEVEAGHGLAEDDRYLFDRSQARAGADGDDPHSGRNKVDFLDDSRLRVGRGGSLLNMANVVRGDGVKLIGVPIDTAEDHGGFADTSTEQFKRRAIIGHVNVERGDSRSDLAIGIVRSGPTEDETGFAHRGQPVNAAGRRAVVDGIEGFLVGIGAGGGVLRVDLVGGDVGLAIETDQTDVAPRPCRKSGRLSAEC